MVELLGVRVEMTWSSVCGGVHKSHPKDASTGSNHIYSNDSIKVPLIAAAMFLSIILHNHPFFDLYSSDDIIQFSFLTYTPFYNDKEDLLGFSGDTKEERP